MFQTRSSFRTLLLLALVALTPALAHAHPGHPGHDEFEAGLAHPLTGLDHLLAMLAIGLWAMQLGGRARWMVPLTFVSVMAAGAALPMAGMTLPGAEVGIVTSVILLGVLVMAAVRLPLFVSAAIAGLFALCHGYAHGAELAAGSGAVTYGLGFILSTLALHGLGLGAGYVAQSAARPVWLRFAGAAVLAGGCFIALS